MRSHSNVSELNGHVFLNVAQLEVSSNGASAERCGRIPVKRQCRVDELEPGTTVPALEVLCDTSPSTVITRVNVTQTVHQLL